MPDVSVAIITKNEEYRLPRCLKSLGFSRDIVVLDSGSTDRTVSLAQDWGCRVFTEEWKGYGLQKNSAVAKCTCDWVLIVDADEVIPPETARTILSILNHPAADAYVLNRRNFLHGRWMKHAGYWPDPHIRLVNRTKGAFKGNIHERWHTEGIVKPLDAAIDHYAFGGYADMIRTMNDYSNVISKELYSSGKRVTVLSPVLHGMAMFLKIFIIEHGVLGGFDGFVTALTKAGGSFFKYAKLLEIQRSHSDREGGEE